MLRGYVPYDWEYSLHPPYDATKLVARLKANDPWGGPLGGACDDESEPEEEEDEDERLPISGWAQQLACLATRFDPHERPAAPALLLHPWLQLPHHPLPNHPLPHHPLPHTSLLPHPRPAPRPSLPDAAADALGEALGRQLAL